MFKTNTETERKFLIEIPSEALLASIPESDKSEITQTYLLADKGVTARVRKRVCGGKTAYTKTEKIRINDLSCTEKEGEITEDEYNREFLSADPKRNPILKTRVLLRRGSHFFEIDIYPFWRDKAVMEIELSSEDEDFEIPHEIKVIKEVTGDKRYKNASLAIEIPRD